MIALKSKEPCKTIAPKTNHLQERKHHTEDAKLVCDISLSGNDTYYVETNDNLSAEALYLDTHLENINNDELEIESCSTNVQGLEEHITNETFVDDASFCECIGNSRIDELASKGDELEKTNTFEFFPVEKKSTMKCTSLIVQPRKSTMNYTPMMLTKVKSLSLYVNL